MGFTKADCDPYRTFLETKLAQHQPTIESVEIVMRENLYGFQGNQKSYYLKITVTEPKFIGKLRNMLENNTQSVNYKGLWNAGDNGILTFDNIQYVLRFMIDTGVSLLPSAGCAGIDANLRRFRECLGWKLKQPSIASFR